MSRLHKIRVEHASSELAEPIAAALIELIEPAAEAVTRFEADGGWRVEAYYADPPDPAALAASLVRLIGMAAPVLSVQAVPEQNWVALSQAALPPVAVGRFTVHGSHDRHRVPRGPYTIEIDAGEAFGTLHHATTQGCLGAIDRLSRRRAFDRVLDLGCGSGILAIAAQRAWPKASVTALDIDPAAVRVAAANMRRNGALRSRVARCHDPSRPAVSRGAGYDFIVANILAGPLIRMAPLLATALTPRGTLLLSGLLATQAGQVRAAYLARGFALLAKTQIAGWSTLTFERRVRTRRKMERRGRLARE